MARVLDVGKLESGAPYMVMEYLEGSDLAEVLAERGAVDVETAAEWVLQACEAIAEAHAAGIVHRDLKPENLFLARTVGGAPRVKVLDFGISKSLTRGDLGSLTSTRAMLGSPLYMSPEQMRSAREADARSDVWALGVVLYELLTKRWPFEAESVPELCLKVVNEPPVPPSHHEAGLPPEVEAIIDRCLQKDPARRYANAAELASALEPLAPPASRAIAERARMAVGTRNGTLVRPDASRRGDAFARTAAATPTPTTFESASRRARWQKGRAVWMSAVAAGLAVVAMGTYAARGRGGGARSAGTPQPVSVAAPAVASGLVRASAALEADRVDLPPAPVEVAPSLAQSPSASVSSPAPARAVARTSAGPKPAATAPPRKTDDDIPALR